MEMVRSLIYIKMESIRPAYRDLAKSSVASRIERESKANDSVDESLSDLSNRSYRRILEETIEDRGFKQRFNLLWGDSNRFLKPICGNTSLGLDTSLMLNIHGSIT